MKRGYLKYIFHIIVVVGVIVAGIKYLNGEELARAIRTFDYRYALLIPTLTMVSFLLKGWRFVVLMRPISNLRWQTVMKGFIAGQAVVLLPGGIAARAGLMGQAGGDAAKSGVPVIFASGLDQMTFVIGSLIAALWFEEARTTIFILLGIILLVALNLIIPRTRHQLLRACDWIARKCNFWESWRSFLGAIPEVATPRTLFKAITVTLLAFMVDITALYVALLGVHFPLPLHKVLISFVLPVMLGRIIPTPGGFGVTEAGMVGFLVSISEISSAAAATAVAMYRVGTIVFEVIVGALVYFFFWQGEKEAGPQLHQREKSLPISEL